MADFYFLKTLKSVLGNSIIQQSFTKWVDGTFKFMLNVQSIQVIKLKVEVKNIGTLLVICF